MAVPLRKRVAIIGGGPGGLMAAERLAQAGHSVTVYDRKLTFGRKFLMAGRGGLNITHSEPLDSFLARYGTARSVLEPAIRAFPPDALRAWCAELGQDTFVGSSGRVFPKALKASPLLRAWLQRLEQLGVTAKLSHTWLGWTEAGALRFETLSGEQVIEADITLLSLGGASWPKLGSDGGWAKILAARGIEIAPFKPANCGFCVEWSDIFKQRFAGEPLKRVTLYHQGRSVTGDAMVTGTGIEGGAIYALSAGLRDEILAHGSAQLHLDLRQGLSEAGLVERLSLGRGSQSLATYLKKAGLSAIAIGMLREGTDSAALNHLSPTALARLIKNYPLKLMAPFGLERAISSAGGIALHELDAHFALKKIAGVYAIGEMLDWEAPTGGYLLQATFSMAVAASEGIISTLKA